VRYRGTVREIDKLALSSSGLALRGGDVFAASDALGRSLSRPLLIESGSARIDLPAGRTACGEAPRERVDVFLDPGGREQDLRASCSRRFSLVDWRAAAGWAVQRGHVRTEDGDPYS